MSLENNCERCTKSTPSKHTPPTLSSCKELVSVPVPGRLWSSGPALVSTVEDRAVAKTHRSCRSCHRNQGQSSKLPGLTQGSTSLRSIPSFVLYHTWGIVKDWDAAQCKKQRPPSGKLLENNTHSEKNPLSAQVEGILLLPRLQDGSNFHLYPLIFLIALHCCTTFLKYRARLCPPEFSRAPEKSSVKEQ